MEERLQKAKQMGADVVVNGKTENLKDIGLCIALVSELLAHSRVALSFFIKVRPGAKRFVPKMNLRVNEISFSHERMSTNTLSENEAQVIRSNVV